MSDQDVAPTSLDEASGAESGALPASRAMAPTSGKSNDVTEGLRRLFYADDDEEEPDYVPGASDSIGPPIGLDAKNLSKLATELEALARAQTSALQKSRGLLVASQLRCHLGDSEPAFSLAREAAETSPKLGYAALSLRKKARVVGDVESVERSLESTARMATESGTKVHAIRMLVQHLDSLGRKNDVGQVLDRAARSGEADEALLVQRVLFRLSQGQSLAGIELLPELAEAIHAAQEVTLDLAATESKTNVAQAETSLIRAARLLAQNEVDAAIRALLIAGLDRDVVDELHAALLATKKEGASQALILLRGLVQKNPTRSLIRELAARAVEANNQEAIGQVLDQADPGAGTFTLSERCFLTATSGQELRISRDEMSALAEREPILALAIGPDETPTFDPDAASVASLLVQLGAGATRLTGDKASQEVFSPAAKEALDALLRRALEPELAHALNLLRSRTDESQVGVAQDIAQLSIGAERLGGILIAGALLKRAGDEKGAGELYRSAAALGRGTEFAATRGLIELGVEDSERLLRRLSEIVEDPGVQFCQELEAALKSPDPGAQVAALCTEYFATRESRLRGVSETERAALLFVTVSLARRAGDVAGSDQLRRTLESSPSVIAQLATVRALWEGESHAQFRPEHLSTKDVSARVLYALTETPPLETKGMAALGQGPALTDLEWLLHFTRALSIPPTDSTAELGQRSLKTDPAAAEVLMDLEKALGRTSAISPVWINKAKESKSEHTRRHAYERLAELDEQRGDHSSALLWHKTLAEEFPKHTPSLLRLEEAGHATGQHSQLALHNLSESLPPGDRETYQLVAGGMALSQSDLRGARKYLEPLLSQDSPPLLAVRGLATVAHEKREDELLLQCSTILAEGARTDLDVVTTALTTALVLSRLGRTDEALAWAQKATQARPDSFAAQVLQNQLRTPTDPIERAEQLEGLAQACRNQTHRIDLWFETGLAWATAEDQPRAATCYQEVLDVAPDHKEAFELLLKCREAENNSVALIDLIQARLGLIPPGGSEHLDLELRISELLTEVGRPEEAKQHLESALKSHPDHAGALRSHANVSAALGAHESAERSLVALRDRLAQGVERTEVLRSLGRLYVQHLGHLEKAMDAYQAVLSENPDDEATQSELVKIFCSLGLAERATALQTKIIQGADTQDKKRQGALRLAEIYETVGNDPKRAGATLERTRKAWPLDGEALEATVLFMDRQGTGGSRGFLLDRAGKDARRQLESERMDAGLLDTLARIARLTGDRTSAEATEAVRRATLGITGQPLRGGGLLALDPKVDDLLAPSTFSAPLRNLLRKTGAAMDAAFSLDLSQMGAQKATSGATFERLKQIAEALGSTAPELYVAESLGAKCLPITTNPARLLIGAKVDQIQESERDYLLLRALKLRWLGAGALARSKDEDRWPMLVALLHLFAPNWRPLSVDGRKVAQARALIEQGLARVGYDDDVPMLALEVIGALGDQGLGVGDQPRILASRVALLGVGDPAIALSAIATSEASNLAASGPSRFRWLEAHPEAKELLLFATTDRFARARQAIGLSEESGPAASGPVGAAPPRFSALASPHAPPPPRRASMVASPTAPVPAGPPRASMKSSPDAPGAPMSVGRPSFAGRPSPPSRPGNLRDVPTETADEAPESTGDAPPPPRRPPPPKRG